MKTSQVGSLYYSMVGAESPMWLEVDLAPPPGNSRGSLMIRAYEHHSFLLIRPAIKNPLFLKGGVRKEASEVIT